MQPVSFRLPHSISEIDSVKWHGIPLHTSGAFVVGSGQQWDQMQKENVGLVWLICISASSSRAASSVGASFPRDY